MNSSLDSVDPQEDPHDGIVQRLQSLRAMMSELVSLAGNARHHNNISNEDDTIPNTAGATGNDVEETNSDVEEIVNEIPVIDLLDSTIDMGPRSKFKSHFF